MAACGAAAANCIVVAAALPVAAAQLGGAVGPPGRLMAAAAATTATKPTATAPRSTGRLEEAPARRDRAPRSAPWKAIRRAAPTAADAMRASLGRRTPLSHDWRGPVGAGTTGDGGAAAGTAAAAWAAACDSLSAMRDISDSGTSSTPNMATSRASASRSIRESAAASTTWRRRRSRRRASPSTIATAIAIDARTTTPTASDR
jgi:hypothetical protein